MEEESKVISGLRSGKSFTINERHQIIQELFSSQRSKQQIWKKYTGEDREHGTLLKWMRQLGYNARSYRSTTFDENISLMNKKQNIPTTGMDSFAILQLEKRILELESQLKDAEMKAIAFSTMIDIAEKEFNIPIRKKHNTKPLKK
jgi:transposase